MLCERQRVQAKCRNKKILSSFSLMARHDDAKEKMAELNFLLLFLIEGIIYRERQLTIFQFHQNILSWSLFTLRNFSFFFFCSFVFEAVLILLIIRICNYFVLGLYSKHDFNVRIHENLKVKGGLEIQLIFSLSD